MPLYDYLCLNCGMRYEEYRSMSAASDDSKVPGCPKGGNHDGRRLYAPGNIARFTEDRLRFWKGPLGNGYSTALGQRMPETRAELERVAKEKGVEFVSPSSMPKEWQEAVDYRKHVDSGGERLEDPKQFDGSRFSTAFKAEDTRPESMRGAKK